MDHGRSWTRRAEDREVTVDRAGSQFFVERYDRSGAVMQSRVQNDGIGKTQARLRAQRRPSHRRVAVDVYDFKRSAKHRGGIVGHAQLCGRDKTLGERDWMEEDTLVTYVPVDSCGFSMMRVIGVPKRQDPGGVNNDHSGQSTFAS